MVCDSGVRQSGHCMEAADGVPSAAVDGTLSHNGEGPAHCPICKAFVSPGEPCKRCRHLNRARVSSTKEAVQASAQMGFDDPLNNPVAERIYGRYASVVTRQDRRVELNPGGGFATNLKGRIFVDPYPLGPDGPIEDQIIATWGGIEHELAHEKWSPRGVLLAAGRIGRGQTDRKYSGFSGGDLSAGARRHVKEWLNVIEDGRIERLLQEEVPGAFKRIRAQDMLCPRWDEEVGKDVPVYYEVLGAALYDALPNFALQIHTYKAMSPEARQLFDRIRPTLQQGVTGDAVGALRSAAKIVKTLDEAGLFEQPQNLPATIQVHTYTGSKDADGKSSPSKGAPMPTPVNVTPQQLPEQESDQENGAKGQSKPQHCPQCGAFVDKNGHCTNCDWAAPQTDDHQVSQGSGGTGGDENYEDTASQSVSGDRQERDGAYEDRGGSGGGADSDEEGRTPNDQNGGGDANSDGEDGEAGCSEDANSGSNGGDTGSRSDGSAGAGEGGGGEGAGGDDDDALGGSDQSGGDGDQGSSSNQAGGGGSDPGEADQGGGGSEDSDGPGKANEPENLDDFPNYSDGDREDVQKEAEEVLNDLREEAARTYANAVRDFAEDTARNDAQKIHDGSQSSVRVQFAEGPRTKVRLQNGEPYGSDRGANEVRDFRQTYAGAARRFARELQTIKSDVQADRPFQRRGRFDRRRMKAAVKGDARVYFKRGVDLDQDIAVSIQVDRSSSMSGQTIREAVKAATITSMALEQSDIPYELRSFRGSGERGHQVLHKDFASPKATDNDLGEMIYTQGSTPMKRAVEITRASLSVREEGIKLAFILADGGPNGYYNDSEGDGYGYETPVRKTFEAMEEKGMTPVLIFTYPDETSEIMRERLDTIAGRGRWVHVRSPASLHKIVSDRIRDIYRNAKRNQGGR